MTTPSEAPPPRLDLGLAGPEPADNRDRAGAGERIVRIRPDVVGIDRLLDYSVPAGHDVGIGDLVRIRIGPRRERGWIVALDVDADPDFELRPIDRRSGLGPTPELLDLADWAAWRWAGRPPHLLRIASPPTNVTDLPRIPSASPPAVSRPASSALTRVLDEPLGVLTLGPGEDRYPLALAATHTAVGHAVILCPTAAEARNLANRLERDGVPTALLAGQKPDSARSAQWARARAGCTVVGTRSAAWASLPRLGRVLVLDEHDEAYQGEQTPTWNARDVVIERARRAGAPCLLVSPTPSPEARAVARPVELGERARHGGWPRVEVVDRRELDPSLGPLFSRRVVDLVRGEGRVLCVLDRTGRVRLLVCRHCEEIARCEVCAGAVSLETGLEGEEFVCSRDDHRRPPICLTCSGTRFKHLRLGVSRAREELEVLARRPVGEVTASTTDLPGEPVLIGTEALLRRVTSADTVIFLDFDQHLLATRHRSGQEALALLALAARIVSRRDGRLVVQTRDPDHPVVDAALHGDPDRFAEGDLALQEMLGLPPTTAVALVRGAGAPDFVAAFGDPEGVVVQGPVDGVWRLRAPDHRILCDALAATPRPQERLRIEVDPRHL